MLLVATVGLGQTVDYDKIVLPENVEASQIEEKLVQLAWKNYPQKKIAEIEAGRAQNQVNKASWDWLNRITVSGNLNEFTINPEDNLRAQYYPRYNFNLSIPLGMFVDQANNSRISRANLEIELEQLKQLKLHIRTEVLSRYEDFKRTGEILKEKNKQKLELERRLYVAQNPTAKPNSKVVTDNTAVIDRLNDQIVVIKQEIITWTSSNRTAKLRLEEFIGVKYEEAIIQ